jgi:HEAT repeat protein
MSSSAPSDPGHPAASGHRRKWLLAALCVAAVVVLTCVVFVFGRREPVYQGVKISRFIELRGYDDITMAALELGPDKVVPYLIEGLRGQDSSLKRAKLALWKRLPQWYVTKHLSQMPMPAESTRMKALSALGPIGPEASAAVPEVARIALDDSVGGFQPLALHTLGAIGVNSPRALEVLLQVIDRTNETMRLHAASALAQFGGRAKPALPTLLREFDRNGPKKPSASVVVLAALGPEAAAAVPVLVEALNDDILAPYAVYPLRRIGSAAADAVPGLARYIEARKSRYPFAVEALMNIGPAARPALTVLRQVADDTNAIARVLAAVAISRIENDPASAIPALVREIEAGARAGSGQSWDPPFRDNSALAIGLDARTTAAWFLGEIGPAARDAVPVLASRLTTRNDWTRIVAAQAIWKINQDTNLALPPLLESLQDTNRGDINFLLAATLLGQLGPAALPAVPHLLEHRKRNWKTWRAANEALKKIQTPGAEPPRP